MALKKLNQFMYFDFAKFWTGKVGKCSSIERWTDHETKKILGSKIGLSIVRDETPYKQKDGEQVTNEYQTITVKIPKTEVHISVGNVVKIINPVATVYGQYRNELSVKADDVVAASQQPQQQGGK